MTREVIVCSDVNTVPGTLVYGIAHTKSSRAIINAAQFGVLCTNRKGASPNCRAVRNSSSSRPTSNSLYPLSHVHSLAQFSTTIHAYLQGYHAQACNGKVYKESSSNRPLMSPYKHATFKVAPVAPSPGFNAIVLATNPSTRKVDEIQRDNQVGLNLGVTRGHTVRRFAHIMEGCRLMYLRGKFSCVHYRPVHHAGFDKNPFCIRLH
jgi:general stress protein 26